MIGTDRAGCELEIWGVWCGSGWQQYVQTKADNDWIGGTCTKEMDGWINGKPSPDGVVPLPGYLFSVQGLNRSRLRADDYFAFEAGHS